MSEKRRGTISKAEVTNERERRERRMEKGARREERVAERDRVLVFVVVVRNGLAFRENEVLRCGEDEGRRRDESATGNGRDRERSVRTSASQNSPGLEDSRKKEIKCEKERTREVKGEGEVAEEAPCLSPSFEPLMLLSS